VSGCSPLVAELVAAVVAAARTRDRVSLAVDGPDAAGKTTLADRVAAELAEARIAVVRAGIDDFHRPAVDRRRGGALSADGYYRDSFDLAALVDRLLAPFAAGAATVTTQWFDLARDQPAGAPPVSVPERAVLVFDGVFALRPELRPYWTIGIYLAVPPDEVLRRALVRDVPALGTPAEVRRRYLARYLPGHEVYRAEADPESTADLVVDMTHPGAPILKRR
jgi:uridine kinase